jgi:hypothetical protein
MRLSRLPIVLVALAVATPATVFSAEVFKWTDENGVTHYADAPPEDKKYDKINVRGQTTATVTPETEQAPKPAATTAPKTTNQSNCETARKNVETFSTSQGISMDRDGDGTPEPLNEEERAKEMQRNQELVKLYCD